MNTVRRALKLASGFTSVPNIATLLPDLFANTHFPLADVTVGFAASSYTISEADAVVEVCVTVLSGQLGTDIALRLDTHSGTAEGVMYVCDFHVLNLYVYM